MFTLPVRTDSLIWSKLIAAAVWFIASGVAVLLSLFLLTIFEGDGFRYVWIAASKGLREFAANNSFRLVPFVIAAAADALLALFAGVLLLYACMSLSMLVNRRRVLFGFGMYIAFSIVGQILASIVFSIAIAVDYSAWFSKLSAAAKVHTGLLSVMATEILVSAALYFITRYMLKRRLNLE